MASMQEYRDEQLQKIASLKKLGIDLYPSKSSVTISLDQLVEQFNSLTDSEQVVVGRIISIRQHGKLSFLDLEQNGSTIQIMLRVDDISSDYPHGKLGYEDINLLTRGDFVEISGTITHSKTKQPSILAFSIRILSKVLRPLPEKLDDKETRLRRRYLDLAINPEVRERFVRRSVFWQATRQFLLDEGFLEINVPVLEHTTGGADANPFVTHMDALDQDFYLRISHELPLKRLIGGGYEKVFDIGPRFRNENYSDEHLPEHVAMEWYWAYADWHEGMEFIERMYKYVMQKTFNRLTFDFKGETIDLGGTWEKWDYAEVIQKHYDIDVYDCTLDQVKNALKKNGLEVEQTENIVRGIDKLWKNIRKDVAGPVWLINTPKFISPLSKTNPDNPNTVERFQPIIAGSELGNGWSELNDPQDQLERFLEQQNMRDSGDDEAQMLDIDYVEMLEYGMPPACGWGNSERVFWIFEGVTAREGVIFPNLRTEIDETTKKIYPEVNFDQKKTQKITPKPSKNSVKITNDVNFLIDQKIFENYSDAVIGFLVVELPEVATETDKDYIDDALSSLKERGITSENLSSQKEISVWRNAFSDFGVKPSKFLSSVEALTKRGLKGNPASVSPFVDVYNAASMKYLIPMGAIDLQKVTGDIVLRYGKNGERVKLLGMDDEISVEDKQVVYADDQNILTWLWNHRDAKVTAVTDSSNEVVYFADSLLGEEFAEKAITDLADELSKLGATIKRSGVLGKNGNRDISGVNKKELPESAAVEGTRKLYLDDWSKLAFEAKIEKISKTEDGENVLMLNQSAFYPGGGGQPNDLGVISWNGDQLELTKVSKDNEGVISHEGILSGELPKIGDTVAGKINAEKRQLNSRLHCAGHLLDLGVKQARLDWKSGISAHFPGRCYVNYDGEVNADDYDDIMQKIESAINIYISVGGEVSSAIVPSEKAHELSDYIPQAVLDSYQNVHIAKYPDDFNICCGGTHVQDVSEIGKVKITKIKKKNGKIRVSYEITE